MTLPLPAEFSLEEILSPRTAFGPVQLQADFKLAAEDFEVEEIPFIQPDGEGEHLWFWIEKRGANTHWVATELARCAGISARDVSWAGLKDRHSISRQYFSMQLPGMADPDWHEWDIEGVTIMHAHRHSRKLKIGALKGNKFKIQLRHCASIDPDGNFASVQVETNEQLQKIQTQGVPNYFGSQRFGRDGNNIIRAGSWLAGRKLGKRARNLRSLLISTVRSCIFNQVLATRVKAGNWNQLLDGEWLQLDGSRSGFLFLAEENQKEILARLQDFDLHPSGPLVGEAGRNNDKMPQAQALEFEQQQLTKWQPWIIALAAQRVASERRALRIKPENFNWQWQNNDCLINFKLPAGCYATVVLNQAFKLIEQTRGQEDPGSDSNPKRLSLTPVN